MQVRGWWPTMAWDKHQLKKENPPPIIAPLHDLNGQWAHGCAWQHFLIYITSQRLLGLKNNFPLGFGEKHILFIFPPDILLSPTSKHDRSWRVKLFLLLLCVVHIREIANASLWAGRAGTYWADLIEHLHDWPTCDCNSAQCCFSPKKESCLSWLPFIMQIAIQT